MIEKLHEPGNHLVRGFVHQPSMQSKIDTLQQQVVRPGRARSAVRSARGDLPHRSPADGGQELLDLVELRTSLCEGGGGDHGVVPGLELRLHGPASYRVDQGAEDVEGDEHGGLP